MAEAARRRQGVSRGDTDVEVDEVDLDFSPSAERSCATGVLISRDRCDRACPVAGLDSPEALVEFGDPVEGVLAEIGDQAFGSCVDRNRSGPLPAWPLPSYRTCAAEPMTSTSTSLPVSSNASRTVATSMVSPGSMPPPGGVVGRAGSHAFDDDEAIVADHDDGGGPRPRELDSIRTSGSGLPYILPVQRFVDPSGMGPNRGFRP